MGGSLEVGWCLAMTPKVNGLHTFELTQPIEVMKGDFLGFHQPQLGVVAYKTHSTGRVLLTQLGPLGWAGIIN